MARPPLICLLLACVLVAGNPAQKPDSLKPESQKPDSLKPESLKPESLKPESLKPESLKPESLKPDSLKPESLKPESLKPESLKPASLKPESLKPESLKPASLKPESQKPESQKPESQKPESLKPDSLKPAALDSPVRAVAPTIAFSAVLRGKLEYLAGDTVIFDQTLVNEGGAYFDTTGQFACTDNDVYVFAWTMGASGNDSVPGMRVIAALNRGTEQAKFGPKVSRVPTSYRGGSGVMGGVVQCRTAPITAITVVLQPWSETNPVVILFPSYPSFSGFKLGPAEGIVAFTAELSEDTYKFPGDTIVFDRVLQNYGNYYDEIFGVFTCPDDDVYVFMLSTYTRDPATPWSVSRLMMEQDTIIVGPLTYPATEEYDSGSATITVVTKCQQSKRIHVQAAQASDFQFNSYGAGLTSFTGFRLAAEAATVAFSAVLAADVTDPNPDAAMVFDKVLTNVGGAYDPFSGHFVCPDNYFYFFSNTIAGSESIYNRIHQDSVALLNVYCPNFVSGGSCAGTVIVQCQPGSRVHVRAGFIGTRTYYAEFNLFSGFRLPGQTAK